MTESPCHTCDCGNYRNCKLRPPRDLTKWERRVVLALLIVLVAGIASELSGCQRADYLEAQAETRTAPIYTDHNTGCEYFASYEGFPDGWRLVPHTPRLGRDGKPICREVTP